MATIRDVARQAGVAPSTVSAILNGREDCYASDETREKVRRVAAELGYRANRLARGLVQGRSRLIGLLLMNVRYPIFAEAAAGVEDEAAAAGYSVLLCNTNACVDKEEGHVRTLADTCVEGIIAVSPSYAGPATTLLRHKPPGVPLVSINRELMHPEAATILVQNYEAAREITAHLVARGHRRILFVGGHDDERDVQPLQASIDRREGYRTLMMEAHLEPSIIRCSWSTSDELVASAAQRTAEALATPDPPTAVFAVSDIAAVGVLRACRQLGRRVPEDVAVAGFDDVDVARYADPPLTSVRQPCYEAGRLAVQKVLGWQDEPAPGMVHLRCRIVLRESTEGRGLEG